MGEGKERFPPHPTPEDWGAFCLFYFSTPVLSQRFKKNNLNIKINMQWP